MNTHVVLYPLGDQINDAKPFEAIHASSLIIQSSLGRTSFFTIHTIVHHLAILLQLGEKYIELWDLQLAKQQER